MVTRGKQRKRAAAETKRKDTKLFSEAIVQV